MDLEQWWKDLPKFTKYFMIGVVGTAMLLSTTGAVAKLELTWEGLFQNYYIWTLITNFLIFAPLSFNLIFELFMINFAFSNLEKYHIPNKYADFVYLLLINAFLCFIYSWIFDYHHILAKQFLLACMYIYCKKDPLSEVRIMFGFRVKTAYLPWVILGYDFLTGQGFMRVIIGIAAGHTYVVLKDILPNSQYKYNFLETPKFLRTLVLKYGPRFPRNNMNQVPQPEPQAQFRFFQGRGVRLG